MGIRGRIFEVEVVGVGDDQEACRHSAFLRHWLSGLTGLTECVKIQIEVVRLTVDG